MVYSNEEIELTLNFYSIAKLHIDNLNLALQFKELIVSRILCKFLFPVN